MTKTILIAVGALALAGIVILLLPSPTNSPTSLSDIAPLPSSTVVGSGVGLPTADTAAVVTKPKPSPVVSSAPSVKPTSNKIVSPVPGAQWITGETHTIQWSEESLGSGTISLIDAKTKAVVGVIAPSLTLHQKTFSWNTRDVFLSKGDARKKPVAPGQYIVRVSFDVGNKASIESGAFTIIDAAQKPMSVQTFIIKNYVATPAKITVKKGDAVYISNNDPVTYKLLMSGFSALSVPAGQTVKFDTGALGLGYYEFYSQEYSGLKLGITMQ